MMKVLLKNFALTGFLMSLFLISSNTYSSTTKFPYVFHLVQVSLWEESIKTGRVYYPPTYEQDGFTHGTSNPEKLLSVANHFYREVEGGWQCLKMTVESLAEVGVEVIFEGTAPVGDKAPDFEGADDELFPHILGGIPRNAVIESYPVIRSKSGEFLSIPGVTSD